jgi:hypothetical protein
MEEDMFLEKLKLQLFAESGVQEKISQQAEKGLLSLDSQLIIILNLNHNRQSQ